MSEYNENEIVSKIKEYIFDTYSLREISDDELFEEIKKYVRGYRKTRYFSLEDREKITSKVFSSIRGFDVLDELINDDEINEIMVNAYNKIFIEKDGKVIKSEIEFENEERFSDVIERIVDYSGKEVNYASPIADTILPTKDRVNIVLPPAAIDGPNMTIRKFSKEPLDMDFLIKNKTVSKEAADFLKVLVEKKYNIFISGGTSSGKTTFLNVLSGYIPEDERIVTIEDSPELQINKIENVVRLQSRKNNSAGMGEITIRDLIKTSLRMRPERIIVGEVRGAEALDMLQAMNTGHDGSLSTGHANNSFDMLLRLETMILSADSGLPLYAVRQQISCALDIIVHLSRDKKGNRRVVEIAELSSLNKGEIKLNILYKYDQEKKKLIKTKNELRRRN